MNWLTSAMVIFSTVLLFCSSLGLASYAHISFTSSHMPPPFFFLLLRAKRPSSGLDESLSSLLVVRALLLSPPLLDADSSPPLLELVLLRSIRLPFAGFRFSPLLIPFFLPILAAAPPPAKTSNVIAVNVFSFQPL